jgi:16S rRNA (uracil1498-N3)-methyltransferase
MRRYWVPVDAIHDQIVTFRDEYFHHVVDVCRMLEGSKFEVLIGDGKAYFCEMFEVQRGKRGTAQARILEVREIAKLKSPFLHLAISLSRFATMDAVLEKAVELGATSFHPFFSDHSFLKQSDKISPTKVQRWQKINQGATQQTGRGTLMEIAAPEPLQNILQKMNQTSDATGLFAYEGECRLTLKQGLTEIKNRTPDELWLFVGSEGGFSNAEVELFETYHLHPLSLGPQILRVETACVALLSIIKYEFDL